jgi:pyruvate/2-oxoglutarate dehydrogenase complex dihydrolipoamide acyltransferase (E2) component
LKEGMENQEDHRSRFRRANIVTILRVPKSGGIPTTKARVVRRLKKEGSKVKQGEPIVELETDKVNYELDSTASGVLLKIVAAVGAESTPQNGDGAGYFDPIQRAAGKFRAAQRRKNCIRGEIRFSRASRHSLAEKKIRDRGTPIRMPFCFF